MHEKPIFPSLDHLSLSHIAFINELEFTSPTLSHASKSLLLFDEAGSASPKVSRVVVILCCIACKCSESEEVNICVARHLPRRQILPHTCHDGIGHRIILMPSLIILGPHWPCALRTRDPRDWLIVVLTSDVVVVVLAEVFVCTALRRLNDPTSHLPQKPAYPPLPPLA